MDIKKSTMAKDINYFSLDIHPCYEDMEPNKIYTRTWGETVFDSRNKFDEEIYKLDYVLNNYGHRCDDFKSDHNKKHVLFAGCSFVFGEAMPYKGNWSGKLYEKLNKENELDGYYCLGFQNGVTSVIINNILKYCKQFGNPETIFCLFPDSVRKIDYENVLQIIYRHDEKHKMVGRLSMFHSIMFLEQYCLDNNIKLLWSTWDESDLNFFSKLEFKNFIYFDNTEVYMKAKNNNEKDNVFYNLARDGAHPGLRYSDGVAEIFLEHLNER